MKKLACLLFFIALSLGAQTVNDVQSAAKSTLTNSSVALAITASQGDGGTCIITKLQGSQIAFSWTCVSSDGKTVFRSGQITSNGSTVGSTGILFGDIVCVIGINPTAAVVSMGSVGQVPVKGIGWSCTTGITGGASTVATNGSVSWP